MKVRHVVGALFSLSFFLRFMHCCDRSSAQQPYIYIFNVRIVYIYNIFTAGIDRENVFDNLQADLRSEQTQQALRVEKLLQSAIMQAGN